MVPEIETARLRLRGHRLEDFNDCAAMWADPAVTRYIGSRPFTREEVWARILRYRGHWEHLGYGFWLIEEKATGNFVGETGFAEFQRAIEPQLVGTPEIGWVLATRFHGQGFATEAVRAAVEWGDAKFGPARTACIIAPENAVSIRVAQKCGYQRARATTYHGEATLVFER